MMPEAGTYRIDLVGRREVYQNERGVLVFTLDCIVEPMQDIHIKAYQSLTRRDGSLNKRTIQDLKKILGWDGQDPFALQDMDITGRSFEIVVADRNDQSGKPMRSVKYINALGGKAEETSVDRATILAQFGSQFRALSGGVPIAPRPSAPAPPVAPPAEAPKPVYTPENNTLPGTELVPPAPPPPEPMPDAPPVGQIDEGGCWQLFCQAAADGTTPDELGRKWDPYCRDVTGVENRSDMGPAAWRTVETALKKQLAANAGPPAAEEGAEDVLPF